MIRNDLHISSICRNLEPKLEIQELLPWHELFLLSTLILSRLWSVLHVHSTILQCQEALQHCNASKQCSIAMPTDIAAYNNDKWKTFSNFHCRIRAFWWSKEPSTLSNMIFVLFSLRLYLSPISFPPYETSVVCLWTVSLACSRIPVLRAWNSLWERNCSAKDDLLADLKCQNDDAEAIYSFAMFWTLGFQNSSEIHASHTIGKTELAFDSEILAIIFHWLQLYSSVELNQSAFRFFGVCMKWHCHCKKADPKRECGILLNYWSILDFNRVIGREGKISCPLCSSREHREVS